MFSSPRHYLLVIHLTSFHLNTICLQFPPLQNDIPDEVPYNQSCIMTHTSNPHPLPRQSELLQPGIINDHPRKCWGRLIHEYILWCVKGRHNVRCITTPASVKTVLVNDLILSMVCSRSINVLLFYFVGLLIKQDRESWGGWYSIFYGAIGSPLSALHIPTNSVVLS